jgi:hypothetical protein
MKRFLSLCENGAIDLLFPQQTHEEYHSNRDDVVARALEELKRYASVGALPALVESHSLGEEVREHRRELANRVNSVREWYRLSAESEQLPFDVWYNALRSCALHCKTTPDIVRKAKLRASLHLPPGKDASIGDRIIWETLLDNPGYEVLHLLTKDSGFISPLEPTKPRRELKREWQDASWSELHLHRSIDGFFHAVDDTEVFSRAIEVGRAIWTLGNRHQDSMIDVASATIERSLSVLSPRQAGLIAASARTYYETCFITSDVFDGMIAEFWRLYARHLDKKERDQLATVVSACGGDPTFHEPQSTNPF